MTANQGSLAETKEILRSLVISSPQTVSIHELNRDFRNSEGYPIPYGKLGFSNLEVFLRSLTDTLYVENNGNVRAIESSKSKHIDQMVAKQKSATRGRKNESEYRQNSQHARQHNSCNINNSSYVNTQHNQSQRVPPYSHPSHPVHQQYNQTLLNQQMAYNYLTNISNQMNTMQRIHHLQYPMLNLPPQLMNRNLLSRPTFFPQPVHGNKSNRNNNNNYRKARTELPNHNPVNIISPTKPSVEPEIIEISSSSEVTVGETSPPQDEEYQLTNSEEEQINEAMNRLKLTSKPKLNQVHETSNDFDDALPELSDCDPIFQINMPSNVVPFGQTIRRAELSPNVFKIGTKIPIFVTEIHNPTKFWFQLGGHVESFDILMKDLSQYYSNVGDKDYLISNSNFRKGQLCAAQFLGVWHRGEIVSDIIADSKVKIFFIDYGTTATVPIKYVRYLLKSFANLPGQVYRGALANIRPVDSHRWSRDSTYCMLSMVMDIITQAKIVDVDHDNEVVSLFLIDSNNQIDIHINNEMITKGYAMAENVKWLSQANITKTNIFYKVYPTFEMLEKGEYPSFYEIGMYLSEGFDLYKYEDRSIIPGIDFVPYTTNINPSANKSSLNPLSLSWYPPK